MFCVITGMPPLKAGFKGGPEVSQDSRLLRLAVSSRYQRCELGCDRNFL